MLWVLIRSASINYWYFQWKKYLISTLKAPRKPAYENVICLCRLPNIPANFSNLFLHTSKQCGPRSDWSSLIWVHTVCRNDFQNHKKMTKQTTIVVIGSLRVKLCKTNSYLLYYGNIHNSFLRHFFFFFEILQKQK